ncbi:filamentous hemagglutinin N-terminal domain-containing protein [Dyella sp. M7H15-1]|uniref:two-partner secretion domain-containing protein n=1 Tax=Dyella sp. M7H15-1 TaxID=2501295 RepID=UPI001004E89A|nr:filamentous hemagglutinin N-terminal domain-containing protein [Dyella sp. M7H15-1]QAU23914.1 filamentous hemagglutinin N-terminal domain-containing protein [Dyella sp. M7H15-1]QAU24936.1 filamentous hemagglutinin N-terminal domain-containing protein [Dyella sp. M7H15-1]
MCTRARFGFFIKDRMMISRRVSSGSSRTLPRHALTTAVLAALLGTPVLVAAQVTPDPNAGVHRPGVDAAAHGTPVVNIVAPSAAGVSHNQYQQFNVDQPGLILNNAANVSPTQFGGYITGNPNYPPGRSAKVIVNEVTSTHPTYLRGYTEVAGNAADVIIANPNGIRVSGAGFINTPRATLTTGVPVFGGDGSLSAFHTTRGAISIDGDGLNASNIDRLDLIARNLAVNGKVWANHLNVATGANQVGYADLSTQAIGGDGVAPVVGVDVAALGGMYANQIMLVATDAGIGVRNAGQLATQSGDFIIDSAGQLQLTGTTSSAGNLTIHSRSLANSGTLQSGGGLSVQTAGDTTNAGTLYSGGNVGVVAGALTNHGSLQSAGSIALQSAGDVTNTGTLYSAGDIHLTAAGTLSNSNLIAAANNATLRAQQGVSSGTLGAGVAGDGSLQGSGALDVATTNLLAANGRNLAAGGMTLQGSALDLSHAQTQVGSTIVLISTAGDIDHHNATLATHGALTVRSAGTLDNTRGTIQAGSLDAQAAVWRNAYGSVQTRGAMTAQIQGLLDNTHGTWISAANAALRAGSFSNNDGLLYAANDLSLHSSGLLQSTGTLYSGQALDLYAGQLDQRGTLRSDGAQTVQVAGDATLAGTTYAGAASQWQVGGTLTHTGTLAALNDLTLTAGTLASRGTVAAGLQSDGNLSGNASLTLRTQGALAATGTLAASGALSVSGSALDLHGATTRAGGDIALTAWLGDINHAGGDLATPGRLSIQAAHALNNAQGRLQAGQWNLQAGSLTNQGGQLLQTGDSDTTLAVTGLLDNANGTFASNANNLTISAGVINNTNAAIQHAGAGTLAITTDTLTNTQGHIVGNGNLVLDSATTVNDGGTLSVAGNATLTGTDFSNAGGTVVANVLQANLGGTLSNQAGLLQAKLAHLAADALTNGNGQIKALDGDLAITVATTLSNDTDGFLGSNQGVNLHTGSLNNAGQLYAGTDLTLTAQADALNRGALQALGSVNATIAGTLGNDHGRLEAGGGDGTASLTLHAASISNHAVRQPRRGLQPGRHTDQHPRRHLASGQRAHRQRGQSGQPGRRRHQQPHHHPPCRHAN